MQRDEFLKAYNGERKCIATYRDSLGDTRQGPILDGLQQSVNGTAFVHVGSFCQRVTLDRVVSVTETGQAWGPAGAAKP